MTGEGIAPVDGAAALALLEAAVETRGADYVYDNDHGYCTYVHDGQPSCLIGTALAIHGVPIDVLSTWDYLSDNGIRYVVKNGHAPFITRDAGLALKDAQEAQDAGLPWGVALNAAREALSETGDSE